MILQGEGNAGNAETILLMFCVGNEFRITIVLISTKMIDKYVTSCMRFFFVPRIYFVDNFILISKI